ncbi:ImmA/IrrE family metallo-endopeptidase [Curtobacterium sp. MCBD17_019]|uniref:ImmA/IrrE family metallo-endopeptidase n=1 Tax=Curtobacterium sp. MCBD17_019 TaxID=2175669 RepID=UPI0035C9258C
MLEHKHSAVVNFDRKCGAGADQEEEADWLAGEFLVPWDAALRQAWRDATDDDVARRYQVSIAPSRRPMNQSGARRLVFYSRRKQGLGRAALGWTSTNFGAVERIPETRGTPGDTGIRDRRHHWRLRIDRTPRRRGAVQQPLGPAVVRPLLSAGPAGRPTIT